MKAFRNGKPIIMCDGCYKTIKRPKPLHIIDIDGREAHVHIRCEAKARRHAPSRT